MSKSVQRASEDAAFGLDHEFVQAVVDTLAVGDGARIVALVKPLHHSDLADLVQSLPAEGRRVLIDLLGADFPSEVLSELDETVLDEIVDYLGIDKLAEAVSDLDSDDAVEVVQELDVDEQREVLDAIPAGDRTFIEEGLTFPEDSAGRLMQRELVSVPEFWTVGETIDFLRHTADEDEDSLPDVFYDIFVVDPAHHPIGAVSLSQLLRNKRPVRVADIMTTELHAIPVTMDQEEIAFLFRQRDLVSSPVVDADGRLVGAITVDDVVDVIDEEHEEDIMRLGGVQEGDLYSAITETTRLRFMWLLLNLATAIIASVVIGLFEATIQQMVALAVLMPIVASMGGNAGTQTMTVAVRALSTRELGPTNALRVIGKEVLVGGFNGVLFALITGIVAWGWFDSPAVGVVIGLAMVINMVVAGLAGTTIPLILERVGIDPAVGSSVLLTTVTDVVGFLSFLGLAAWLLF